MNKEPTEKQTECFAEKVGHKIGNVIWVLVGTKELICKGCKIKCPYGEVPNA